MTLAILCSGQGPQGPQMFALTGDAPQAASLFTHAATLLGGRDPREIAQSADDAVLHQNRNAQVLCVVQALAAKASVGDACPRQLIVAGYSVGEVAAWSVAGLVEPMATLDLVARRAEAMDAASVPGDGLLFVRGLARDIVEDLCRRHDAATAIVNPGDAYMLGGPGPSLDALGNEAKKKGASRVVRAGVNVASHTVRLSAASTAFRAILDRAPITAPAAGVRLFSGIDGSAVLDVRSGLDKLAAQISQTVEWAACLDACVEAGATGFLELGPGRALAEMATIAHPVIPARSLEDFRTLRGVRTWLDQLLG
ncbi:MAG TPA: acyltransferase domain-containing protein [Reyranella sp.]|nr:acyltransferase domain-containing protein [Reyranella sp.]